MKLTGCPHCKQAKSNGLIRRTCRKVGGYAFSSTFARETGVRWLKIANVGFEHPVWDDASFLPIKLIIDHPDFVLHEGDMVVAMTRPIIRGKLKIARLGKEDVPAMLNQRVGRLQPKAFDDNRFVYHAIQHGDIIRQYEMMMLGTDPPNLSSSQVESARMPIPPSPERSAIAERIDTLKEALQRETNRLKKTCRVKTALMQDLLTGEVEVTVDEEEEANG